ncbi:hypothetical protein GHJ84_20910 [Sinorhizobium meliloti]|uniref:hypothetical protein n=1 Tax=Rhizobium meliloti TaxID=382 RepID=UPI0012950499|nr:hypothetical protein [Sinorhizobium meliloti]MQX23376.1 hypothetical protein [Sinorhizobium meliloti]
MTDDSERPKFKVVAENTQAKIDENWAQQFFDQQLLDLAANIIRVVRGAGKPYAVIPQCNAVLQAAVDFRDRVGALPSSASVANALMLREEEIRDYASLSGHRGTFYFQVRHANDFNGFPLEILECPDAIRS